MNDSIEKSSLPEFILSPKYKIWKNLFLLIVIFFITVNIFTEDSTQGSVIFDSERILGWICYYLSFVFVIYFNMHVLVPRFLLLNKLVKYLLSVLLTILIIIVVIIILQSLFSPRVITEEPNIVRGILSIVSSVLTLSLMIAGTSAISLFKFWMLNTNKVNELQAANLESELQFLKNQINPHFLFNMLNNANIMSDDEPEIASAMLIKLEDMIRYQFNDSTQEKVSLEDDILFITDFLDLENIRRDNFEYTIKKQGNLENISIPPLLFVTFVENAVKHNQDSNKTSYVHILFELNNDRLTFTCANSKPDIPVKRETGGLGLVNIKRRLDLLYGKDYSLDLNETETTYTVNLKLKV